MLTESIPRLRQARISHGMTQLALAEALGVSQVTIGRWERGETIPYPIYRKQLRELFREEIFPSMSGKPLMDPLCPPVRPCDHRKGLYDVIVANHPGKL